MLRAVIPVILLLSGVAGGVWFGMSLTESSENEIVTGDGGAAGTELDLENGTEEDDVAETRPTVPPRVEPASDTTEYVRLNNQFIVPIVRDGSVRSLVVLGLSVEVLTGGSAEIFNREPRIRDSFLRVLFAHANAGGFDGNFTEAAQLAPLREGLVEVLEGILGGEIVYDVLITDITRQDA